MSPFSPTPRNPLIPLKIKAPGEAGAAVGNVDGAAEMIADPFMVCAMASPGESGAPAKSEETGATSGREKIINCERQRATSFYAPRGITLLAI